VAEQTVFLIFCHPAEGKHVVVSIRAIDPFKSLRRVIQLIKGIMFPVEVQEIPQETQSLLYSNTEMTAQQMDQVVADGTAEDYKDYAPVYSGIQSWASAKEEIGNIDFTTDADGNGSADCFTDKSITVDDEGNYIVTVEVAGDQKTADFVVTYVKSLEDYAGIVTNVNYSFGELMQQAGLNTLLGMGTTFFVLILLSLIIAGFGKFFVSWDKNKAEKARKKDEEAKKNSDSFVTATPVAGQAAPAAEAGDDALIAVIAAAVSAYREQAEPTVAPDGFVVRKIRRIGRK
jgi:sodium pump decarboxylase gamma subunit